MSPPLASAGQPEHASLSSIGFGAYEVKYSNFQISPVAPQGLLGHSRLENDMYYLPAIL